MFRRLGNFLTVLAMCGALGAHWTVLQSIAWTTMLADNLGSCSLTEAVHKTFDGRHPCCLCQAIAEGKKSDQKKEFTSHVQRLEYPPLKQIFSLIPPVCFEPESQKNAFADSLAKKPLIPPPRALFV